MRIYLALFTATVLVSACTTAVEERDVVVSNDVVAASDGGADDGEPIRQPCVSSFGDGLSGTAGRLDGTIVAVVSPSKSRECNAGPRHVHIQVLSRGQIYDVAVNVSGGYIADKQVPLPGAAWDDGWHPGTTISYPTDLGLTRADFRRGALRDLSAELETELAHSNHVSVYGTTYNRGGIHLIHRVDSGRSDGAVFTDPLSPSARVIAFHFSDQQF